MKDFSTLDRSLYIKHGQNGGKGKWQVSMIL